MSKQTALQWFKDVSYPYLDKESKEYVDILFNHALQMEQEQIIETWKRGNLPTSLGKVLTAEEYYKQTYGGNNDN
jgi:hypothetical protein